MAIPVFCVETGEYNGNPVGDYFYNGVYTYNTVLLRGGSAAIGSSDGALFGSWYISARPRLKNP